MGRSTASALCLALCLLVCGGWTTTATPSQALRTCVDRWNQSNMRSWRSMSVRVAIRALDPRERSTLGGAEGARRVCTLSLAFHRGGDGWICRIEPTGAYFCPLETSDGMPPVRSPNGETDRRGHLTVDVPLADTHAAPPLPWQRYPHVDGYVLPWGRNGKLRSGLHFGRAVGAQHYRGTCSAGSQKTVAKGALRCYSDWQFDPCFAPTPNWNHRGAIVACTPSGGTTVFRFLVARRS